MHALPTHVFGLTAAAQRAVPQPAYLELEGLHACPVAGHGEVACMPGHHRAQILRLLGDGPVQPLSQRRLDRQNFGARALGAGEAQHHELAFSGLAAAVREPEEVEGVGFALSPAASILAGEARQLDQPRLVGAQLQPEMARPLNRRALEALGIVPVLKPGNPIVGITHRNHVDSGVATVLDVNLMASPHPAGSLHHAGPQGLACHRTLSKRPNKEEKDDEVSALFH